MELSKLLEEWEARSRGAHPSDAMLINLCIRELRETLATEVGSGGPEHNPEDRFEHYIQTAIAKSPEPLRELGEFLTRVLDEDEFPNADRLLLQLATTPAAPSGAEELAGHVRELRTQRAVANADGNLAAVAAIDFAIATLTRPESTAGGGGPVQEVCRQCGRDWPDYTLKDGICIKCRKPAPVAPAQITAATQEGSDGN